jgi:hypothetical protein
MGAGQLVEVDVHGRTVVRTLGDLPNVHGVIVVPDKHRAYATATGRDQMVAIEQDSGAVAFAVPTDAYPDALFLLVVWRAGVPSILAVAGPFKW